MPSTYTTNGGIEKIATGEQSGTWGDTTNTNFDILDRLTNGVGSLTLSGTSSNLQTTNGTLSDGQYKALVLGGSPSGTHTITVLPDDAQKIYFVQNNTSESVVISQGVGTSVTIDAGSNDIVYCDGGGASANVSSLVDRIDTTAFLVRTNNLSDLTSSSTALTNLGISATAAELSLLDGSIAGSVVNSKGVIYGASGEVNATTLQIGGSSITASAAELNYNDITTLGTSQANKVVTADANGDVKFSNAVVETVYTLTGTGLDPNNGTIQTKTLSGATTFTDSLSSGESMVLYLSGGSSYTVTWPTINWVSVNGNSAPTLTSADVLVFFKISSTLYGLWSGSAA